MIVKWKAMRGVKVEANMSAKSDLEDRMWGWNLRVEKDYIIQKVKMLTGNLFWYL